MANREWRSLTKVRLCHAQVEHPLMVSCGNSAHSILEVAEYRTNIIIRTKLNQSITDFITEFNRLYLNCYKH